MMDNSKSAALFALVQNKLSDVQRVSGPPDLSTYLPGDLINVCCWLLPGGLYGITECSETLCRSTRPSSTGRKPKLLPWAWILCSCQTPGHAVHPLATGSLAWQGYLVGQSCVDIANLSVPYLGLWRHPPQDTASSQSHHLAWNVALCCPLPRGWTLQRGRRVALLEGNVCGLGLSNSVWRPSFV